MKISLSYATCKEIFVGGRILVQSVVFLLLASSIEPLYAHDFWIEPTRFAPAIGDEVPILLRVGMDLAGDRQPYINDWFSDYRVVAPAGARPIEGLMGDDPAGSFIALEPGIHVVGYRSTRDFVDLGSEKFNKYLADEGLDRIIALRAERGESDESAPEYYSRCAKSLISVAGGMPDEAYAVNLGYPLELIPEQNPYSLSPGDDLTVRLLYSNEPIQGILVIAFTADAPEQKITARTDTSGRATLVLDRPGFWLVKAVHMIETPPSVIEADWESFWASLTFRLPES